MVYRSILRFYTQRTDEACKQDTHNRKEERRLEVKI
nr:MAG TPA: hypothetical protein [Caudoviricetes sp.]